jgi:HAD superfamily hydrolase (TIGR01509 family)
MDGVMIDSEKHWQHQEHSLINSVIPHWTLEENAKIIGMSIYDIYQFLVKEHGLRLSEADFMHQVDQVAHRVYGEQCNLLPGLQELIEEWNGRVPLAVASSSKISWIYQVVDRFELTDYFKAIVSFEDIEGQGKPAPDIYLHTATALGVEPKHCVVIEDSTHGIAAAKAAGMFVLGLRNGFNDPQDLSEADEIIEGFIGLNLDNLTF